MRVLAVDVGRVRVGLAISDPTATLAQPLGTLMVRDFGGMEGVAGRVAALCREHEVEEVVVGLPRHMNGSVGQSAAGAQQLQAELRRRLEIPVTVWDERLSTKAAEKALLQADVSRAGRRAKVDQVAAALILESYLATRRNLSGCKEAEE